MTKEQEDSRNVADLRLAEIKKVHREQVMGHCAVHCAVGNTGSRQAFHMVAADVAWLIAEVERLQHTLCTIGRKECTDCGGDQAARRALGDVYLRIQADYPAGKE